MRYRPADPQSSCAFFRLPNELKQIIYQDIVPYEMKGATFSPNSGFYPPYYLPSIADTCQRLRQDFLAWMISRRMITWHLPYDRPYAAALVPYLNGFQSLLNRETCDLWFSS